jgi:predicted RNA binding protein YcfA (HicA-like mRNA interferase family)
MSQFLPSVTPKEFLEAFLRAGFFLHHSTGDHHVLKHPNNPGLRVTVPMRRQSLKRKTLVSVMDHAGYAVESSIRLL